MGMFGGGMARGGYGPSNWADVLSLVGAGLKDASPISQGGNLQAAQQMMFQRQMFQRQQQMLANLPSLFQNTGATPPTYQDGPTPSVGGTGLIGGLAARAANSNTAMGNATVGGQTPLAPDAPDTSSVLPSLPVRTSNGSPGETTVNPAAAIMYKALGIDPTPGIEALKFSQPHLIVTPSGETINDKSAQDLHRVFPKTGEGQILIRDSQGNPTGIANIGGYADALAQAEAAKTAAQEGAKAAFIYGNARNQAAGAAVGAAPYTLTTKDVAGVPTTMTTQQALGLASGGAPGAPTIPTPAAAAGGKLNPQTFFKEFVMPHEGGFNASDMNGSPTNFGINQAANPEVDVSKLTPASASKIFADKYFAKSGAADLPPALAAIHADTYFIQPKAAMQFLQQSGGDPGKYMQLRQAWMQNMVANNPAAAKYAKAWAQRNADLTQYAGAVGNAPTAAGNPTAPGFHGVNPADEKSVQDLQNEARTAETAAMLGDQFIKLNKTTATGPMFDSHEVHLPLLGEVPLNPFAPAMRNAHNDVRAMDNLTTQLALTQRAPGQRMTQMEFQQNRANAPNINNPGPQNSSIVATQHAIAGQKRAYADFKANWLAQNGSLTGSEAAWQAQQKAATQSPAAPAPAIVGGPRNAPSVGMVQGGYRFKGGNPADPNSWTKVQ